MENKRNSGTFQMHCPWFSYCSAVAKCYYQKIGFTEKSTIKALSKMSKTDLRNNQIPEKLFKMATTQHLQRQKLMLLGSEITYQIMYFRLTCCFCLMYFTPIFIFLSYKLDTMFIILNFIYLHVHYFLYSSFLLENNFISF